MDGITKRKHNVTFFGHSIQMDRIFQKDKIFCCLHQNLLIPSQDRPNIQKGNIISFHLFEYLILFDRILEKG